jgi:hypothetical protein
VDIELPSDIIFPTLSLSFLKAADGLRLYVITADIKEGGNGKESLNRGSFFIGFIGSGSLKFSTINSPAFNKAFFIILSNSTSKPPQRKARSFSRI